MTLLVNLFAGPGTGKSTMAAELFAAIKKQHINCELITEVPKDYVWDGALDLLNNQVLILGNQYHRIFRVLDKVEIAIIDSSILYGLVYKSPKLPKSFDAFVLDLFNLHDNCNFYINRTDFGVYQQEGRVQSLTEAIQKDKEIKDMLDTHNIKYNTIPAFYTPIPEVLKAYQELKE